MEDGPLLDQSAPFLQIFHNDLVRIFHIEPLKGGDLLGKSAVLVDRNRRAIWMDNLLLNTHPVIVLSETRSTVHHSSTIRISDKTGTLHSETSILSSIDKKVKQWLILCAFKILSLYLLYHFVLLLSKEILQPALCEDENLVSL